MQDRVNVITGFVANFSALPLQTPKSQYFGDGYLKQGY